MKTFWCHIGLHKYTRTQSKRQGFGVSRRIPVWKTITYRVCIDCKKKQYLSVRHEWQTVTPEIQVKLKFDFNDGKDRTELWKER